MRVFMFSITSTLSVLLASISRADSVEFLPILARCPTPAEVAGGVPSDAIIRDFFVTTDADILSIGFVDIDGNLYQHPAGSNSGPPSQALLAALPTTGADSFIDTPGNTTILGRDMPGDGTENSAWGDLMDNGPQTSFRFARLTMSPRSAPYRFDFAITIAGQTGPISYRPFLDSFQYQIYTCVPEPQAFTLLMAGAIAIANLRRNRPQLYAKRAAI